MRYYDISRFGDGPESIESGFIYPVYAIPKIVVGNSDTIKFPGLNLTVPRVNEHKCGSHGP